MPLLRQIAGTPSSTDIEAQALDDFYVVAIGNAAQTLEAAYIQGTNVQEANDRARRAVRFARNARDAMKMILSVTEEAK